MVSNFSFNFFSSCRQICINVHCNRIEWTQDMVLNTYDHIRMCLEKEWKSTKKIEKNFLTNVLPSELIRALPENPLFSKYTFFVFPQNFGLTLKYHHTTIANWENTWKLTQKHDPISFWQKVAKKSNVRFYPNIEYHFIKWLDSLAWFIDDADISISLTKLTRNIFAITYLKNDQSYFLDIVNVFRKSSSPYKYNRFFK